MPGPAVYVLAVLGTVGAALAFKEFVYEPHIAPAIERWKAELHAARRRREMEGLHEAQSVVQMSQRRTGSRHSKDKFSDDDDSSDDENHLWNERSSRSSKLSRDGLLIRPQREMRDTVELDAMVATEINEWRNAASAPEQVLRQRKNIPEHAMDESVQAIPYSPIRPHVLFDPSSPVSSTPTTQSQPHSPAPSASIGLRNDSGTQEEYTSPLHPASHLRRSSVTASPTNIPVPVSPLRQSQSFSSETSPEPRFASSTYFVPPEQPLEETFHAISYSPIRSHVLFDPSSPLSSTHATQSQPQSPAAAASPGLSNTGVSQGRASPPSSPVRRSPSHVTTSDNDSRQSLTGAEPQPQASSPYFVPSLSQSYPQDLDYEHGLELLSPPSSRADTPFSLMAELSPRQGLQTLSGTSAFSSAVSSPSPLAMGLGNQSYDAISPPTMHLEPSMSSNAYYTPPSVTNSARSTTYLSFEDSAPSSPRLYAHLGRDTLSASPAPPIHSSLIRNHMYADPSSMVPSFPPPAPAQDPLGLGLLNVQQPQRLSTPAPSDSDLSDLDFMSDYQPSEPSARAGTLLSRASSHAGMSDNGHESDSSWSMAGSNVGSPVMVPAPRPMRASSSQMPEQGLSRGGTIRQSQLPPSLRKGSSSSSS